MRPPTRKPGQEFIAVIILVSIAMVVGLAVVSLLQLQQREGKKLGQNEQTYHIAEAGIHYYRWHLAHNPDDFQDGTGAAGPYVHEYKNRDGVVIGQFSLTITPPPSGSTVTTIRSTGSLIGNPVPTRTVVARLGIPSLSRYAVAANADMRFGSGTETFGAIHSNGGIRYDGIAHGLVTSEQSQYDDPDHCEVALRWNGSNWVCDFSRNEFGVHTHVNPPPGSGVNDTFRAAEAPPSSVASRADVFQGGRQFPVVRLNFNGITADLAALRTAAQTNGIYLTASGSGAQGYHLTLRTNDTLDMRRVTAQTNCQTRVRRSGVWGPWYGSYSIATESSFTYQGNSSLGVPLPANGVIFIEDDVWVDGTINTARVTVAAARDPLASGSATIIVNNNLTYTNTDGSDAIGLIAQRDFSVGLFSANVITIDAAIIAQTGRAGRYYYGNPSPNVQYSPSGCAAGYIVRSTLTNLGSIVTNQRYGFAYTDGTGYITRNLIWDSNLLFAPPPLFPTTGEFTVLSWDEEN